MTSLHFHPLRVRELQPDTDEAVIVSFDVPAELKDTFRHQAGQYLSSSEIECKRGPDWSVVAAGANFGLACTEIRRKSRVHRPLGEAEWAVWDQGIAALMAECVAEASRAQAAIAQTHSLAERHFFVPASAAGLLTHGLGVYLQELADLQNQAQGCQDQHGSC